MTILSATECALRDAKRHYRNQHLGAAYSLRTCAGQVDTSASRLVEELVGHEDGPFTEGDRDALARLSADALRVLHARFVAADEAEDADDDPNVPPEESLGPATHALRPPSTLDTLIAQGRVPQHRRQELVTNQERRYRRQATAGRNTLRSNARSLGEPASQAEIEAMLPKSSWR